MTSGMPTQAPSPTTGLPRAILILGAAKSGTTALFYAIRNGLAAAHGGPATGLFEPRRAGEVESYLSSSDDQVPVVKMLLGPLSRDSGSFIEKFDKKILIYRDPRDNVVSRICFMLKKIINPREKEKIEQALELFRKKEQAPDSISVVEMLRQMELITGRPNLLEGVRANSLLPAKIKREYGEMYFMMPYDDMVLGRFGELNRYLGMTVSSDYEVPQQHSHVVRSKSSGAWKDWFLKEDVQFFARDVADDFAILGFDPEAEPNTEMTIDAKTSSEYVASQFQRLRDKKRLRSKEVTQSPESTAPAERAAPAADGRRERRRRRRQGDAADVAKGVAQPPGPGTAGAAPPTEQASSPREEKRNRRRLRRSEGRTRAPQEGVQSTASSAKTDRRRARRTRRRSSQAGSANDA